MVSANSMFLFIDDVAFATCMTMIYVNVHSAHCCTHRIDIIRQREVKKSKISKANHKGLLVAPFSGPLLCSKHM